MTVQHEMLGVAVPSQRSAPSQESIGGAALLEFADFELAAATIEPPQVLPARVWDALVRHHTLVVQAAGGKVSNGTAPPTELPHNARRIHRNSAASPYEWPLVFERMPNLFDGRRHDLDEIGGLRADTLHDYVAFLRRQMGNRPTEARMLRVLRKYAPWQLGMGGFRLLEKVVEMNPI